MLNLLATVKAEVGDLSRVARFVKVVVFVNLLRTMRNSTSSPTAQPTYWSVPSATASVGRPGPLSGWLHCRSGLPWRSRPSSRRPPESSYGRPA